MGLKTFQPGAACPPRHPQRASEMRPGAWPALRASHQVTFPGPSLACSQEQGRPPNQPEEINKVGAQTSVLGGVSSQNGQLLWVP